MKIHFCLKGKIPIFIGVFILFLLSFYIFPMKSDLNHNKSAYATDVKESFEVVFNCEDIEINFDDISNNPIEFSIPKVEYNIENSVVFSQDLYEENGTLKECYNSIERVILGVDETGNATNYDVFCGDNKISNLNKVGTYNLKYVTKLCSYDAKLLSCVVEGAGYKITYQSEDIEFNVSRLYDEITKTSKVVLSLGNNYYDFEEVSFWNDFCDMTKEEFDNIYKEYIFESKEFTIRISDKTAPQLSISENFLKEEYKISETILLKLDDINYLDLESGIGEDYPVIKIFDDEENVCLVSFNSQNKTYTFIPTKVCEYRLEIIVCDNEGNSANLERYFNVIEDDVDDNNVYIPPEVGKDDEHTQVNGKQEEDYSTLISVLCGCIGALFLVNIVSIVFAVRKRKYRN